MTESTGHAPPVGGRTIGLPQDAQPVIKEPTGLTPNGEPLILNGSRRTKRQIPISDADGSKTTESASDNESLTSRPSAKPSTALKRRWKRPRNVREFAAQANAVATMLLNGDLDIDTARTYSSLARGVAQMMSINVTRARFLKEEPVLDFDEDE